MKKLNVGIIGAGNISTTYLDLAPLFRTIEIKAIADINPDAARTRAEEYSIETENVEGLLGRKDIDIVVNLTIPGAHYPVTKSILEAGKHAYCEKPFVLNLEDGKDLHTLAVRKGLCIGSAPDTFLGGAHQTARLIVDDGKIGEIVSGTCHVMNYGMEHWHPNPDFFFQPGGGPMLDLGPYYIANLIQLIGPVKRVAALTSIGSPTRTITSEPRKGETIPVKTPTNIHALLEFQNGAAMTMSASWDVRAHRHQPMELYGTLGSLFVPDPNFFGGTLELADSDGNIKKLSIDYHPFGIPNQRDGDIDLCNYRSAGLADMAASIIEGHTHRCSLEFALHVVDVMTAILESGRVGSFVDMKTSCKKPAWLGPDEAKALMA